MTRQLHEATSQPTSNASEGEPPLLCSFCHKSQHDVANLIAGDGAHICNECVELCVDIISSSP